MKAGRRICFYTRKLALLTRKGIALAPFYAGNRRTDRIRRLGVSNQGLRGWSGVLNYCLKQGPLCWLYIMVLKLASFNLLFML